MAGTGLQQFLSAAIWGQSPEAAGSGGSASPRSDQSANWGSSIGKLMGGPKGDKQEIPVSTVTQTWNYEIPWDKNTPGYSPLAFIPDPNGTGEDLHINGPWDLYINALSHADNSQPEFNVWQHGDDVFANNAEAYAAYQNEMGLNDVAYWDMDPEDFYNYMDWIGTDHWNYMMDDSYGLGQYDLSTREGKEALMDAYTRRYGNSDYEYDPTNVGEYGRMAMLNYGSDGSMMNDYALWDANRKIESNPDVYSQYSPEEIANSLYFGELNQLGLLGLYDDFDVDPELLVNEWNKFTDNSYSFGNEDGYTQATFDSSFADPTRTVGNLGWKDNEGNMSEFSTDQVLNDKLLFDSLDWALLNNPSSVNAYALGDQILSQYLDESGNWLGDKNYNLMVRDGRY